MKRFLNLSRVSTSTLIAIPIVVGFLFMGIQLFIFKSYSGTDIENLLISFTFFFWGLSGVPMVIRKEAPGSLSSETLAVIQGFIMILFGWGVALGPWIYKFVLSGK